MAALSGPASAGVAHINGWGKQYFDGVLECRWTGHKGRVLHATRSFAEGDVILVESPLHIVQEEDGGVAFERLKKLCVDFESDFDYEPLWYWCALQSLTKPQLEGAKGLSGATQQQQDNLLLLHHEPVTEPSRASEVLANELAPACDPVIIERLTQIWVLNCFEYSDSPQGYSTYFFSSFMSHSCFPNAVWHYTGADHVLRARRPISIGDEVCIAYLPEHGLLQSAPVRRMELHDTKRFWCACERCAGERDRSRGFYCPSCKEGKVFSFTPVKPAKDAVLLAEQLMDATCDSCGHQLTKKEATKFAAHEKKLKSLVDDYVQRAEDDAESKITAKELQATEDFIDSVFVQHVLADRVWEQLADCYACKGRRVDQRRVLERRCEFHKAAYPGLSGAHAWALEAFGDAMINGSGVRSKAKKRVWQEAAKEDPEEAMRLYTEAYGILALMFGIDHEYTTQVEEKRQNLLAAKAA